jgi:nucleoside phosphorylase
MPPTTPPTVDIGILTIKDDEFRAVLDVFPKKAGIYRGHREYTLRDADTADGGRYTVAIVRQIEQGNGEAQEAARDLLDDLNPSLLLVIGIAGGLPSEDITLGDVVISTRVNDYNVEARKARSKPTYSLSGGPIAKELQSRVANLLGREEDLGRWTTKLPARPTVRWNRQGSLYGPKRWQTEVKEKLQAHFGRGVAQRAPVFAAGPIASSDKLVKDPKMLFPWIETARHLLAIEMESGGVYRAARERCPMLAIRGISDIVGFKRSDSWTKYACASAAAFARAFLRTRPVEPRIGSTTSQRADALASTVSAPITDKLYANLAPLKAYSPTVYVTPANVVTYKQGWARLREGATSYVTQAWVLHNRNVYSFEDPGDGYLSKIVDTGATEAHAADQWAKSADPDKRRLFVHLLNGALRDDLAIFGVRFAADDKVYYFAGRPDDPPRRYKYKNVRLWSTMTVVSNYEHTTKDGKKSTYFRHLAFDGRFRLLGDEWFLEISPTYRFTIDGRKKSWLHEYRLSGIKRYEGNRAVLSQVLLWSNVLCAAPAPDGPQRHLGFDTLPVFEIERPIADDELTSIEAIEDASTHPQSSLPSDEPPVEEPAEGLNEAFEE